MATKAVVRLMFCKRGGAESRGVKNHPEQLLIKVLDPEWKPSKKPPESQCVCVAPCIAKS